MFYSEISKFKKRNTYTDSGGKEIFSGMSRKQRLRSSPAQSWTPMMPKMKKTKKQSSRTLPSMGSVSRRSMTRMRIPVKQKYLFQQL